VSSISPRAVLDGRPGRWIARTVARYYDPGANDLPARATKDQQISLFPSPGSFSFDAITMKTAPGRARPSTPTTTEHRQRT
jgi:hypothetical protein